MHPVPEVTLAAIFRACTDNRLQWYLKPGAAGVQQQQGEPLQQPDESSPSPPPPQLRQQQGEQQRPAGAKSWVPALSSEQLAAIAADLPAILPSKHRAAAEAADANDGTGCFRSRGGCWLGLSRPRRSIMMLSSCSKQQQHVAGDARIGGSSSWQLQQQQPESYNNISGSHCEAATAGPCLGDPSPSPDSINQPGSSGAGRPVVPRHVTFGALPPSVVHLQKEFRRMRGEQEALERAQQAHADMLAEEAELQQQMDAEDQQQQQQLDEHEALRQCVQQAVCAAAGGSGGSGGSDGSGGSGSKGKRPRERDSADGQTDCSDVDESDSAVSKFRRIAQPPAVAAPAAAVAAAAAAGQAGSTAVLA
jgi:hypothetical protein